MSKIIVTLFALVGVLFAISHWAPSLWVNALRIPSTTIGIPYAFFAIGLVFYMTLRMHKGR